MFSLKSGNNNFENLPTILDRIAQADKLAAKECVDTYGGMIWALAKKSTNSAEDAEKAIQEIFVDSWQITVAT